jgi:hypothetical protein
MSGWSGDQLRKMAGFTIPNETDYSKHPDKTQLLEDTIVRLSSQFVHAGYLTEDQVLEVITKLQERIIPKLKDSG